MIIPILADASLPGLEEAFPLPFKLTLYHSTTQLPALLKKQDILLCRSTLPVNQNLIENHSLKIVATASSGSDHIDSDCLFKHNISLFDAKGSNATSVADYILSCIAYLRITHGFNGRKTGIIGGGAVGSEVAMRLQSLDFEIIIYDPPRAERDPNFKSASLSELVKCELICVHANRHNTPPYPSINLLSEAFLKQLHPGTVILNAARGGIINEEALLSLNQPLIYCTDVYTNEPRINPKIVELATLCTPHIAGHSIEAKKRAVTLISEKLHAYYHLSSPLFLEKIKEPQPTITSHASWDHVILSLYNPKHETEQLKKAAVNAMESTFQRIRQAHHYRHDFNLTYHS